MSSKRKQLAPRPPGEGSPPDAREKRRPRLASEPVSRHQKLADRWEAGFLRLPGGSPERELSYVVDGIGIYFDATSPSELELLLERGGWETPDLLGRAERGIAKLRSLRLSRDNDPRRLALGEALARSSACAPAGVTRPRVTVVDQPRDDDTIGFGLAGPARFESMLDAAIAENPGAEIVVVMDPSVSIAARSGYLHESAAASGATLVRDPVEAWSVVEGSDRLYVLTAHVGFEAALAGRPVTCFGVPYYSGWGFTDDRLDSGRRTRRLGAAEVFAAAYLAYSRYFEPYDGGPCSFEEAVEILDLVVAVARDNVRRTLCLGFAPWKRRWVGATFGSLGIRPVVSQRRTVAVEDLEGSERVIAWASRAPEGIEGVSRAAGVPFWRMEDGFLRSIGLGVGLRPGASYVLDRSGIYYDATRPSDLETLLETQDCSDEELERAARMREAVVRHGLSKYNVGEDAMPPLPRGKPVILVAGQVEDDASIRLGAADIGGNAGLLRRVRLANPQATIAYKPHPDVEAGLRPGHIGAAALAGLADVVLRDVAAPAAIAAADRVEVATSLLGFEALLRGKPVRTHGMPFYAGWGLTEDSGCVRRTRRLSLDALVAGALIRYPRYVDPRTGLPCSPELLVRRMSSEGAALTRRERTFEAILKETWSLAVRNTRRAG